MDEFKKMTSKYDKQYVEPEQQKAPTDDEMSKVIEAYAKELYDPRTTFPGYVTTKPGVNLDLKNIGGMYEYIDAAKVAGIPEFKITSGVRGPEEMQGILKGRLDSFENFSNYPEEVQETIKQALLRGDGPDNPNKYSTKNPGNWIQNVKDDVENYLKEPDVSNVVNTIGEKRREFGGWDSPHAQGDKFDVSAKSLGGEENLLKFLEELKNRGVGIKDTPKGPEPVYHEKRKDKESAADDVLDIRLSAIDEMLKKGIV